MATDHPKVEVTSRAELRAWLAQNHATSGSIWLVTWKKSGKKAAVARHVPYDAIVEECLCFGWVDSLPRKLDADRTMLRLSPRKPGSTWSAANRARIARLEAAGLMTPAGSAVVAAARGDGSWDRLKTAETGKPPDDLRAALVAAGAMPGWQRFSLATRKRMIEQVEAARRPETRAARIETMVAGAREGRDPLLWRGKRSG